MELSSRVFPLDWTTVQTVAAVVGVLIVVLVLLAFVRRRALRRQEERSRAVADQLASLIAGEMMARSQQDGDRFSLKEGNSIATLIAEAVLALNAEDTRKARRSVRQLKSANSALATELFAEMAHAKLDEAERASHQAAAALRHQGALTLPKHPQQALGLFQRAFEARPDQRRKSPRPRSRAVQARRSPQHRGLDGTGAGGRRPGAGAMTSPA